MSARSAAGRRMRFGLATAITLVAATACMLILNLLGARFGATLDATKTGEHRLAPLTSRIIDRINALPGVRFEIVIAADLSRLDSATVQRVDDVLDQLDRATPRLSVTFLDTRSASGLSDLDDLLARLAEREQTGIDEQTAAYTSAADTLDTLAAYFRDSLAPALTHIRDALDPQAQGAAQNTEYFTQRAAAARLNADQIGQVTAALRQALETEIGPAHVPATDRAAETIRQPLGALDTQLSVLAEDLSLITASDDFSDAVHDLTRPLARDVAERRNALAVLTDRITRLPTLDIVRVARILESTEAALVIGPPEMGLTAVSIERLLPPQQPDTAARIDAGRNAEELLAAGLGSLLSKDNPVVVLAHAGRAGQLDESHEFDELRARIALRGIDMIEWPIIARPEPPSITEVDPTATRPVVYAFIAPSSWAVRQPDDDVPTELPGPEVAKRMAEALRRVLSAGQPVLLSLLPSTLPTFGQPDQIAEALAPFGLKPDTGRPILEEQAGAERRFVAAAHRIIAIAPDPEDPNPVLGAVAGRPTRFNWPVPIARTDSPGRVRLWPLYTIQPGNTWAEAEWLGYFQVPLQDHPNVTDPPSYSPQRDDKAGPWTIAWAAERREPGLSTPQRLIVVGSYDWYGRKIVTEPVVVDGQLFSRNPGNAELFEAAVLWLAGRDDLIAQTPAARAAPLIRPLTGAQVRLIRWLVIVAMPVLVLITGLAWRWVRG